ncbi:hypothetical protein BV22DRAFT_1099089, partial [Leucogyrophana mollusca]
LVQLRTGHAPLNKHLHRINRSPTPLCPECQLADETVHHLILTCPGHTRARYTLLGELDLNALNLHSLLNTPTSIRPLLRYIARTNRLVNTFGDVSLPDKDN